MCPRPVSNEQGWREQRCARALNRGQKSIIEEGAAGALTAGPDGGEPEGEGDTRRRLPLPIRDRKAVSVNSGMGVAVGTKEGAPGLFAGKKEAGLRGEVELLLLLAPPPAATLSLPSEVDATLGMSSAALSKG